MNHALPYFRESEQGDIPSENRARENMTVFVGEIVSMFKYLI